MWLIDAIRNWWGTHLAGRPYYWGEVKLEPARYKMANHLTTHRLEHDLPLSVFEELLGYARAAGVQYNRGPHCMPWALRKVGHLNKLRSMCQMMQVAGITPVPLIDTDTTTTENEWQRHCEEVARGLPAHHFEIFNEPDNRSTRPPAECAKYLAIASDVIRKVRPSARIIAPGLGHGKAWSAAEFLGALDRRTFDYLSIHLYDAGKRRLKECLQLVPDCPAWITEDGGDEAAMRGSYWWYLKQPRVQLVGWYCLWNPDDWKRSLLAGGPGDFRPKPAFEVFEGIR